MDQNVFYTNSDGSLPTFPRPAKEQGQFVKIAVNPTTHRLLVDATGGGGGAGDASAANQLLGNASLTSINTSLVPSLISTNNSSATPLTGAAAFTGTGEDVSGYSTVSISVFSDVISATDGLQIQQSTNNTNWDIVDSYTCAAATGKTVTVGVTARYFRVVYTNGAGAQATFRLQSILHRYDSKSSSVRPQDGRSNENDFEEVAAYGSVFNGTSWDRLRGDATNGAYVQSPDTFITGQGTQTVAGNNVVLATAGTTATDASLYKSVSIQIVPTGTVSSGVVTFEGSNDNTNFVAVPLYDEASLTANPISTVSPTTGVFRFFTGPIHFRYFRARISTVIGGGGSIQAFTRFSQSVFQPTQFAVTQATGANLNTAIASGTVTTVSTLTTLANGQTAHSAASTGSPVRVAGRVNTTLDTSLVQGDASDLFVSTAGQLVEKPYSTAENDWVYATPIATPITGTTGVVLKAAGAASIRNYVTGLQYHNSSATASIITVQDGVTVIWTGYAPASMAFPANIQFVTPLRGTAATAMNFVVNTTATSTIVSAQGYQSF